MPAASCQQPSAKASELLTTEVPPTPGVFDSVNFTFLFCHYIIKNIQILPTQLSDTQAGFAQSGEIQFEYLLSVRTMRKENKLINKEFLFNDFQASLCLSPNHK